jgi:hypothetical protein
LTAAGGLDDHAPTDAQFAHGAHDFDEQALHGLDATEHFYFVNRVNGGCEGFHQAFP